jgi:hypothetical protein
MVDHLKVTGHRDIVGNVHRQDQLRVLVNLSDPLMTELIDSPEAFDEALSRELVLYQCPVSDCLDLFTAGGELGDHIAATGHCQAHCTSCNEDVSMLYDAHAAHRGHPLACDWLGDTAVDRRHRHDNNHAHGHSGGEVIDAEVKTTVSSSSLSSEPLSSSLSPNQPINGGEDSFRVRINENEVLEYYGHKFARCDECHRVVPMRVGNAASIVMHRACEKWKKREARN